MPSEGLQQQRFLRITRMFMLRQLLGLACAWSCCCVPVLAQRLVLEGPEPALIKPAGRARLHLKLEGASAPARLIPPAAIAGLSWSVGPARENVAQVIEGGRLVAQPSVSWEIELEAAHAGTFAIAPWQVEAAGASYSSPSARLECVDTLVGAQYAFVELESTRSTPFVGERIPIVLRIGVEREFARHNLVPMFPRPLDLPVQIEAPWLAELEPPLEPGGVLLEGTRVSLALDQEIAFARAAPDVERDGRTFRVIELERAWLAPASGEHVLAAPLLRFASATRFEGDALGADVARDFEVLLVPGNALALAVQPLPEAERPASFTGAVGTFTLEADAVPRELRVGESTKLALRIAGTGDLMTFEAPRIELGADFRVLGMVEERAPTERRIVYDVAVLRERVGALPSVELAYFDPTEPAGYRTLRTEPIELLVLPGFQAKVPEAEKTPTPERPPVTPAESRELNWPWLVAGALIVIAALVVRRRLISARTR
jgi:hypothetical protein